MIRPANVTVPLELAIAACSPLALAALKVWLDLGARPKRQVRVFQIGQRLMAMIDFETPVAGEGRLIDGYLSPIMVTLADPAPGEDVLARIRAGDDLRDRLRAALAEARP